VPTTTAKIMSSAAFRRGVEDRRGGRPLREDDGTWDYERGRLWASLAPIDMPLHIDGKLNPKAVALYNAASDRKLIL
jgi:hypothetical protein